MLNYDITRMKERAVFGKVEQTFDQVRHRMGNEKFKPVITLWCGLFTQTQTQTQIDIGMKLRVRVAIVVRHNKQINDENIFVKYRNELYKISSISSDDRINAFDVVYLEKSDKKLEDTTN